MFRPTSTRRRKAGSVMKSSRNRVLSMRPTSRRAFLTDDAGIDRRNEERFDGGVVVQVAPHAEQPPFAQIPETWREAESQQMAEAKQGVCVSPRVGVMLLRSQVSLVVQQAVQDVGGFACRGRAWRPTCSNSANTAAAARRLRNFWLPSGRPTPSSRSAPITTLGIQAGRPRAPGALGRCHPLAHRPAGHRRIHHRRPTAVGSDAVLK